MKNLILFHNYLYSVKNIMYSGMVNMAFETFMKKLGMPECNFYVLKYGKQRTTPVLLLLINVLEIIYLS